ncbi:EthD domain-containing protein [Novosphingobium sp. RD2P27]|uniref:EthD domain-containing protein n=1 Tax=Novosphingobium kalidii TaxID=3230299 RepID=A0ABV2D3L4_9SPHN
MTEQAATIYKILLPMKRKPGLSTQEFREYYENHHAPLAAKYSGALLRYVRTYLEPHPHPETGEATEPPYDVITELWFDDEATYRSTLQYLTTTKMSPEIVEDEKRLFDRSSFCILTTVERETDLDAVREALKS